YANLPIVDNDAGLIDWGCCLLCDASSCGQHPACCGADVCKNSAACSTMCSGNTTLDPACHGRVDLDCDDFPEDCDQLCCPCKPAGSCMACPQGQIPCGGTCVDATSDDNHCGSCDNPCLLGTHCVSASCM